MSNTIDSTLLLSSYQAEQRETSGEILGKDDFLKILMTQLQNQDPLNPMQDKDFIAQMATFSSLEQMTNLGKSMDNLVEVQKQNQLISYNQFVGKEVTWHQINEDDAIIEGTGKITGVKFGVDSVEFTLDDGTVLTPSNISEVNHFVQGNDLVEASHLIGRNVGWINNQGVEEVGSVLSVFQKDGEIWLRFLDEREIEASQLTKIE
ncbi:flagellar hook assembly protein FlgD [Bacillus spongiae]|uniref:Basal-body rod modification protein FlgD n=1 Tax=Bacillus spongiae TaxID=2683610 RepID=A0ABU8HAK4_9BACI